MAVLKDLVSRSALDALTEFSTEFDAGLAAEPPSLWQKSLGRSVLSASSNAILTKYPIPVSAAGYKVRTGDDKMRQLYSKTASVYPYEWEDGVKEKAAIVRAPDFIGWAGEPSRIALEAQRLPQKRLAALIEANPTLEFDGKALFATDHPVNVFGEVSGSIQNLYTTDVDAADLTTFDAKILIRLMTHFRSVKAPNGEPMGLRLTHLIVPPTREYTARQLLTVLQNPLLAATLGGSNIVAEGLSFDLIVADELTDADKIYGACATGPAFAVVQDGGTPEEIRYDEDSEMYKNQGMIGVKYILSMGTAALLPHSIACCDISP
jgi:phage major head subunit gpT-like protein